MTPLSYVNQIMDDFKSHFEEKMQSGELEPIQINGKNKFIIFLSIGNQMIRAVVTKDKATTFDKAWRKIKERAINIIRTRHIDPQWIKVDFVTRIEEISFIDLEIKASYTRKNYFRYGISFDEEFRLAFLEQEINGNAMIRKQSTGVTGLHEKNVNHYLNQSGASRLAFMKSIYANKHVYLFSTVGAIKERDEEAIYDLYNGELTNGIRKVEDIESEVENIIKKSTYYLADKVKKDGKFEYGYFSAFAKRIATYNILRHSSSLYALTEGYEIVQDPSILEQVEKGLAYLIEEAIVYKDGEDESIAYVVDHANDGEIKLGSNATAILAMTKYMEVTGSERYLEIARALARGIIEMKLPDGGFIHVLEYPSFRVKSLYRIIYYEGEAIFSLLRLYALDKDNFWLDEVKKTFEHFIQNDYWKYHDHWLSYAANELTIYEPKDKYFKFGLKNCNDRLDFIYHRETTFPTFLELTMAAYKMIGKIKGLGKTHLLEYIDEDFLVETIDRRAEYQRVGFFYPELAMYKKNPDLIVNGFFIRHHSFRVRIDDVEHYLSGYCQYLRFRIPNMKNTINMETLKI